MVPRRFLASLGTSVVTWYDCAWLKVRWSRMGACELVGMMLFSDVENDSRPAPALSLLRSEELDRSLLLLRALLQSPMDTKESKDDIFAFSREVCMLAWREGTFEAPSCKLRPPHGDGGELEPTSPKNSSAAVSSMPSMAAGLSMRTWILGPVGMSGGGGVEGNGRRRRRRRRRTRREGRKRRRNGGQVVCVCLQAVCGGQLASGGTDREDAGDQGPASEARTRAGCVREMLCQNYF
jgi:hypothetical protein